MKTHYDVLGIPPDADDDVIKTAYRKALKAHHPDLRVGDSSAEQRSKRIIAAYEVLKNPDQRARYDAALQHSQAQRRRLFAITALTSAGVAVSVSLMALVLLLEPEPPTLPLPAPVLESGGTASRRAASDAGAPAEDGATAPKANAAQQAGAGTAASFQGGEGLQMPPAASNPPAPPVRAAAEEAATTAALPPPAETTDHRQGSGERTESVAAEDDNALLALSQQDEAAGGVYQDQPGQEALAAVGTPASAYGETARERPSSPPVENGHLRCEAVSHSSGELNQALADLDRVIRLSFADPRSYCSRGLIWLAKGRFDRAIADFTRAIKLAPDFAEAHLQRGIALREKGDPLRAIDDLERALQLDPDLALARHSRDIARIKAGSVALDEQAPTLGTQDLSPDKP